MNSIASFGYHPGQSLENISNIIETTKTVEQVTPYIGYIALITLVVLPIIVGLAIGIGVAIALFAIYGMFRLYSIIQHSRTDGVLFTEGEARDLHVIPEFSKCEAIPTDHSADTILWRKELIQSAKHNIILSGNYCGGQAFVEFLELIEQRLWEEPNLKVIILSSPIFLSGPCKKKLDALLLQFPKNMSLVRCPSSLYVGSSGIKLTMNHAKCLVVDYGRYFILGGSGIKDDFSQTGIGPPRGPEPRGFLANLIPRDFRDQDWVFSCQDDQNEENAGRWIYRQMLLLANRWEIPAKQHKWLPANQLGLFTGRPNEIGELDTLTTQLLKTPIPSGITTTVPAFVSSAKKANDVWCKIFASGPEHSDSSFQGEILQRLASATKEIVINHMYFHPTKEIANALTAAIKRGVQVTVVTCGVYDKAPWSHWIFGPRNRYNLASFYNNLTAEEQERMSVFEFRGDRKGYHKKVIAIDREILVTGSSNFGYKSLVTASDHEVNFIAESRKLVEETLKSLQIDIEYSEQIDPAEAPSYLGHCIAGLHRTLAPLIG